MLGADNIMIMIEKYVASDVKPFIVISLLEKNKILFSQNKQN